MHDCRTCNGFCECLPGDNVLDLCEGCDACWDDKADMMYDGHDDEDDWDDDDFTP